MADTSGQEINLFYCYAREDRALRDELEKHLSWLKRRYQLKNWHDREILPGEARCITSWPNRDEAFREVVIGISRTIKAMLASFQTREA